MGYLIITAVLAVIGVAFTICISATGKLVADDFRAWAPRLTEWLVAHAVARLPEDQRDRYGEEWRSHVNDIPGDLSKIFWAVRYMSAARKVLPEITSLNELQLQRLEALEAAELSRSKARDKIRDKIRDRIKPGGPPGHITAEIVQEILLEILDTM
jgi:hypothetical protein